MLALRGVRLRSVLLVLAVCAALFWVRLRWSHATVSANDVVAGHRGVSHHAHKPAGESAAGLRLAGSR